MFYKTKFKTGHDGGNSERKKFKHAQTRYNWVTFESEEFKVWNLVTKKGRE